MSVTGKYNGYMDLSDLMLTTLPSWLTDIVVTGSVTVQFNNLTNLKGCPSKISGEFVCSDNPLKSLEHGPLQVSNAYRAFRLKQLTSLKGAPKHSYGTFACTNCPLLSSLEHAPRIVDGEFECNNNGLTSLEGGPEKVHLNYDCSRNKLTDLQGAAVKVGGVFDATGNKLTSLQGMPEYIFGWTDIRNNVLTLEVIMKGLRNSYIDGTLYYQQQRASLDPDDGYHDIDPHASFNHFSHQGPNHID